MRRIFPVSYTHLDVYKRQLPERISVARATLPQGVQTIEFQTGTGAFKKEVEIGNRFTIIPIRITGGAVYIGQPSVPATGLPGVVAEQEAAKPVVKPPARKPVTKSPAKKAE